MNKKLLTFVFALFAINCAFGELANSRRYFEIGVEAQAGVSNNYYGATDVFVQDLTIDLTELAENLSDRGFVLDNDVNTKFYFAVNANKYFRFSFFWGVNGSGYGNISKNLFDMLGKGIGANTNETIDIALYGDLYAETGFSVKTDIKDFGIKLAPSFFFPLVHVAETKASVTYKSTDEGLIRADADIPVNVYSVISLENISDQQVDVAYIQDALQEVVKSVGFDFTAEIEHQITKTFDMGIFTRIPIVPGRLNYKATKRVWGYFEQNNLLGVLDDTNSTEKDYGSEDVAYTKEIKFIHRPFILGLEGAWRPFGQWCVFRPKVNMSMRNPFTNEYQIFGEYSLQSEFVILKVLGLNFGTAYENQVFKQTVGLMINARVLELDAYVQTRGGDFLKSFDLTGLGAFVGVKIGF